MDNGLTPNEGRFYTGRLCHGKERKHQQLNVYSRRMPVTVDNGQHRQGASYALHLRRTIAMPFTCTQQKQDLTWHNFCTLHSVVVLAGYVCRTYTGTCKSWKHPSAMMHGRRCNDMMLPGIPSNRGNEVHAFSQHLPLGLPCTCAIGDAMADRAQRPQPLTVQRLLCHIQTKWLLTHNSK